LRKQYEALLEKFSEKAMKSKAIKDMKVE